MLVLIFGPTGAGKSEIIRRLVERKGFQYVPIQMTRPLRPGETDKEYISKSLFSQREAAGDFIWVHQFLGFLYGTPRKLIEAALSTSIPTSVVEFPLVATAQLDGLKGYKLGIVIMPPSKEILLARLKTSGRRDRLNVALEQFDSYLNTASLGFPSLISNRIIVNEDIEMAYKAVERILASLI